AGFKRFREIMAKEPEIKDSPNAIEVEQLTGNIQFHQVDFSYDEDKEVLNNIDLDIKPGETVAFVGPSGAGKSTICSLIPRFYDVDDGSITIDDIDIRDM